MNEAPRTRARKDEDKLERRREILAIARTLIGDTPFQAIAMAQVAERAGLAKGTLYLYFATKEELFLALLEEELEDWFAELEDQLGELPRRPGAARVASTIRRSLEGWPTLLKLLGILHAVLEQNVAPERVLAFKRLLLAETTRVGDRLERLLPGLAPGQGATLVLRAHALVVGLQQVATPAPAAARAMREDPALAVFALDFGTELEQALTALMIGMERPGGTHEPQRVERKNRPGDGRFERPWG